MKIILTKNLNDKIPAGTEIAITPNKKNYFVGLNGTGKTITFSALAAHLNKKLRKDGNWMTPPPAHIQEKFRFEGFEGIEDVYHFTSKSRQSQWCDLGMVFESAGGVTSLTASEGMNNQMELVKVFNEARKDKKRAAKTLYIFDEIDGSLDIRAKTLFFDHLIQQLPGTVIVCSHDVFFMTSQDVFDFTDGTRGKFSHTKYDIITGK